MLEQNQAESPADDSNLVKPGAWFNGQTTSFSQQNIRLNRLVFVLTVAGMLGVTICLKDLGTVMAPYLVLMFFGFTLLSSPTSELLAAKKHKVLFKRIVATAEPFTSVVEIDVIQNGILTGSDIGLAWFENDALHFSGEQMSFVIGGQQLAHFPRKAPTFRIWNTSGAEIIISLKHPTRRIQIGIRVRHQPQGSNSFWKEILSFQKLKLGSPVPQQYLPLGVHPGLRYDNKAWLFFHAVIIVWLLVMVSFIEELAFILALPLVLYRVTTLLLDLRRFKDLMKSLQSEEQKKPLDR